MPRINLLLSRNFADAVRAHAAMTDHGFSTRAIPELVQQGLDVVARLTPDQLQAVCEAIRAGYAIVKGAHRRNETLAAYTDGIDAETLRRFIATTGFRPKTRAYRALAAIGLAADQRALSFAAADIRSLLLSIADRAPRDQESPSS